MSETQTEIGPRIGDRVFEALQASILSGEYRSGDRLRIRQLAASLGTSVMPVRESLARLEEVGLVETSPHRGAVVKQFTAEELLQIYSVRRILEVEATVRGAQKLDEAGRARLDEEFAAMESALDSGDASEYLDHDEELLATIYSASGNPVLVEAIRTLWLRCRAYKLVGARREIAADAKAPLLKHQRRLMDAVDAGDPAVAAEVTDESFDDAVRRIRAGLGEQAGV
ncbi:GntR family transcriptional regulator [Brevibacterium linens]|uniref:DNA-binding transcriptional regulator, GntR family n=1 Tax=Brevibacterium linens ATCC 9172 TaxID=1255617 RepID=A0A2H1JFN4_BRELN|nr:GntR family transcriptional regulator [Brevibacterium linens]KAB1947819.1 GntR family transcriptional regulator [Brevibacterium linens ATCC 9172]SMX86184.1 DNA-binding transcriptional regulator, GntR family [Brevibacterium linens ATCC 9172]